MSMTSIQSDNQVTLITKPHIYKNQKDLFKKDTDKNQYLLLNSCHPKSVTKSIPFSLSLRITRICTNFEKYGEIEQSCQIWELITSSCREQKVRPRDGGLEKQRRYQSRDIQVWLQWLFLIANNFWTRAWNFTWMPDLCSALSALLCSGAAFLLGLISSKSVLLAFNAWKSQLGGCGERP